MTTTQLLITGNCLRYDIAAQLAQWLPALRIVTVALPDTDDASAAQQLGGLLAKTDLWLTMGSADETAQLLAGMAGPKPAVCRIPVIGFAAFHPDICFAVNAQTGEATRQVFNSAIGVWAYRKGLTAADAASLFCVEHFKALGYLNAWEPSVRYLREAFATSDLAEDFTAFFYAVKRDGCFMQTFNHPNPAAIARLCALICARCGLQAPSNLPLSVGASPASRLIWPVYPAIADYLGIVGGSYVWHLDGRPLHGLEAFLSRSFSAYAEQGIAPDSLQLVNRDMAILDQVLRTHVGNA